MIEPLEVVPDGVIGLRSSGQLTRGDYVDVLEPAIEAAVETGEIRLLFVLEDFGGAEAGAWIEDAKTGANALFKHRSAWKRFALVTDEEWIAKAAKMFAWMAPGEMKVFPSAEAESAKAWVAA